MRRRSWGGVTDNITPKRTVVFLRDPSRDFYSTQEHEGAGVFSQ
jgi:hypothetical protein